MAVLQREIFVVGDRISWDPQFAENHLVKELKKKFGEGPFRVAQVVAVPAGVCGCGMRYEEERHRIAPPYDGVHCTVPRSTADWQWIQVVDAQGKPLCLNGFEHSLHRHHRTPPGCCGTFSNYWFHKVS